MWTTPLKIWTISQNWPKFVFGTISVCDFFARGFVTFKNWIWSATIFETRDPWAKSLELYSLSHWWLQSEKFLGISIYVINWRSYKIMAKCVHDFHPLNNNCISKATLKSFWELFKNCVSKRVGIWRWNRHYYLCSFDSVIPREIFPVVIDWNHHQIYERGYVLITSKKSCRQLTFELSSKKNCFRYSRLLFTR